MSQVVIGDIIPYTQATASASQTVFGTNWTVNALTDVVVFQTPSGDAPDDATQQLDSSQFSVTLVGSSQQVQVTLVTGASAGDIITVTRQTPADYLNLYSNTNFVPSMLNNDFSILTLVDQQAQLVNQLIGPRYNYSAVIAPNSEYPNANIILPLLPANCTWMMNSDTTEIETYDLSAANGIFPGLANDLAYYATDGIQLSPLATANSSGLLTNGSGVPGWVAYTGSGAPVLAISPNITTPVIYGSNGAIVAEFVDVPLASDYLVIASGINNSPSYGDAGIYLQSSLTDASLVIYAKGNGGVQVGVSNGDLSYNPFAIYNGTYRSFFYYPSLTADRTLQFPDANVILVGGTMAPTLDAQLTTPTILGSNGFAVATFADASATDNSFVFTAGNSGILQIGTSGGADAFIVLTAPDGVGIKAGASNPNDVLQLGTIGGQSIVFRVDNISSPANYVYFSNGTTILVSGTMATAGANANITSMTGLTGYLASPLGLKDSSGNVMLGFTYAATPTDYFQITNGANNGSSISVVSSDTNASAALYAKGSGGWLIAGGTTTNIPMALGNTTYTFGFYIPTWTGNHTVTLPDGNVVLSVGTMLVSGGALGTPSSGDLANCTLYPVSSLAGAGTGVLTALGINIGSAGAPVLFNGAGGTPSSLVGTNITGTAASLTAGTASAVAVGGITGLGTGVATALAVNVGSAGAFVTFNGAGGTPSSMTGTNITGTAAGLTAGTASAVAVGGITGLGTGVATALAINIGSVGAFVAFNGAGGTPSSMTGTNITGTAAGLTAGTASAVAVGGITGLGTGVATALAANVNGSGAISLATSPTFVTPVLGAATATSINFGGSTLSAYATGSWTPIDSSGATLTFTLATGTYIKIGNLVWASCQVTYPSTSSSANAIIGGLPFVTGATLEKQGGNVCYTTAATLTHILTTAGGTIFSLFTAAGAPITNVTMSTVPSYFQIIYSV